MKRVSLFTKSLGALFALFLACAGYAAATPITVNKSFTPSTVNLGAASTVVVTFQNNNTTSAAAITSFKDDIGTTMAGFAFINAGFTPTTTCAGGTPVLSGNVITMNNGSIPQATGPTAPGACTLTFQVIGAKTGNSVNTIFAADVTTSLGSPPGDVSQTLNVAPSPIVVSAPPPAPNPVIVPVGTTATTTFKITNPTSTVTLTNVSLPINLNVSTFTFTVTSADAGACGGSSTLPVANSTSGTINFTGITIPAGGSCTISVTMTSNATTTNAPATVNLAIPALGITSDQGVTNTGSASNSAKFVVANPAVTKAFSPTSVLANGASTSRLTITILNHLSTTLTGAAITDPLPAGITLATTPNATTTCTGGTVTPVAGPPSSIALSGATIPSNAAGNASCTVSVNVQASSTATNTIPKANFTSNEVNGAQADASASLTVSGAGGLMTVTKQVSTGTTTGFGTNVTVGPFVPVTFQLTFTATGSFTNGTVTDNLPQTPQQMLVPNSPFTSSTCGGTVTAIPGSTSITATGLSVASGTSCTIRYQAQVVTPPPGINQLEVNSVPSSSMLFDGPGGQYSPPGTGNANVTVTPTVSLKNYAANVQSLVNQPVQAEADIVYNSGTPATADSNLTATFPLNAGQVVLAGTPNFTFVGCDPGAQAIYTPGAATFQIKLPSISSTCRVLYNIVNAPGFSGSKTPGSPTYTSTQTGGATSTPFTPTNTANFQTSNINITKTFLPNQIQAGAQAVAAITVNVSGVAGFTQTTALGVSVPDTLPSDMAFASNPNVTFSAGCQQTGQPAPTFTISGQTITAINISLLTNGTTPINCTVGFNVTSSILGAPANTIPAGAVTSTSGITNSQTVTASLTVAAGVAVAKSFTITTMPIGATTYMRLIMTNTASTSTLNGGTLSDTMPTGLALASNTPGPLQPGDPVSCGATINGTVGNNVIQLTGITMPPLVGSTPGQCVEYVAVTSSASATPNSYTNTIPIGGLLIAGFANQTATSGTVTLTAPPAPVLSKAFAPATIAPTGTSVLTITVANTASGAAALSGMALTDSLPTNVIVAATPNASTTCTGGTVTATAGGTSVALSGGTVGANATCTITVSLTSTTPGGPYVNTIPAGALTTTQQATNAAPATANLTVANAPAVTLSKTFAPTQIMPGGTSVLTLSIANTASGALALSSLALTDSLPSNVTIAATPNAATTCGSGTVTALAGATSVALSGGAIAAGATCTITVNVTSTVPGSYLNTVPAGAVTSAQGGTNTAPATATLQVGPAPAVALSKAFAPAAISPGGTSTLTIAIANTASGALPLTALALSDTLPSGVLLAATPNASTTCASGTVTAAGGGTSVALAGGTLGAGATCTVTVTVTGALPNTYVNTIPAGNVSSSQGATNTTPATANLVVNNAPAVALSKAFAPGQILPGGTSTLTISIANTASGAVPLSALALSDALPSGVLLAATPNATTTCTGGTVTATGGGSSVTLASGTLGANATCTVSVNVTGTLPNTYVNTIPTGNVSSAQGASNSSPATANLVIANAPAVTLIKAFAPVQILPGGTSTLTITVANNASGAGALSALALSDTLPSGVLLAAAPNASTTCTGGTVTAPGGGNSVTLAGGTVAAGATCTVTVTVTGMLPNTYVNTIPAGNVSSAQGASNSSPATANLVIANAPPVTLAKSFNAAQIVPGGTSALTISIANTAPGAIALTALALSDALPANVAIAPSPNASTTCAGGSVGALPGATSVALTGGTLAPNATCTVTVSVTSSTPGSHVNTIPANNVSSAQGATNTAPATATLTVVNAPPVTLSKAFAPALIAPGVASVLTISIANTASGAVALSGLALTDTLPANITVAATPNASTTCPAGAVNAAAGSSTVALAGGTLAAGATCTITVSVTGTTAGTYTNTIPAGAVTSVQGATNSGPAQAQLTIGQPQLSVTKTSNPSNASVSPGQSIAYSIAVTNTGTLPETNARIAADTLVNATLTPGSVTVNGTAAPDGVITAATPFGSIAPGATTTITYRATVNANAANGAQVTNNVTVGGDQACTGPTCSAVSPPNTVRLPVLTISKVVEGQLSVNVVPGQVITYTISAGNTGIVAALNTVLTDVVPNGVVPIAGTVTINGVASPGATVNGQTVTVPLGTIAPSATLSIAFQARVTITAGSATNTASLSATGASALVSNPASVHVVPPTIAVTKIANATTVNVGDRVDYSITVSPTNGVAYGATTVVDTLPAFEVYAPGTARVNGKQLEPVVAGHTLTWTLPALAQTATITYSVAIAPGAPSNGTLTNNVDVSAVAPGGAAPGRGSASASVLVTGSTFGSCYPITGRVYLDAKGSGRFEDPDVGLAGVHIFLDNGESVVTDSTGRYSFPCVHPGMHALRLDESSLPPGVHAYDDRNIDSEKSTRRLVHKLYDTYIIEDINFAVTGTLQK